MAQSLIVELRPSTPVSAMSGPITAGYFLMHGLLLLSARALQEARSMKCEFGAVRDQLQQREHELADLRRRQREARVDRVTSIRRHANHQSLRLGALRSLAESLAVELPALATKIPPRAPSPPITDDDAAWSAFVGELDAEVRDLEALLVQAGGQFGERVRAAVATTSHRAPGIDDVLAAYVLQRQLKPGLDAAQSEHFRATAARVLGRLELPEGGALPADLAALAHDIVLAPSLQRAEALASELRHAVQRAREARAARLVEAQQARVLLEQLPDDAPAPLLLALERVAAGVDRLDASLRASVDQVTAEVVLEREHLEQQAACIVLEESLRDLGYEVEGIDATLFVQGGVTHFRRPGWDNYFVRLRVDADEHTVNFNVTRARRDEESTERRRLDALAEDRWCTEFPKLLQTLAARGLRLDVSRSLGAGEVPVQVVDGDTLPPVQSDEAIKRPHEAPRSRQLP